MKRLSEIDFLRGIAVILVLFRHHWVGIDALQHVGWIGVDLFFVLSGFLVSGLLFAEHKKFGDVKPFHFLIRRGFKIYPMFYLSLFVTFVLSFFFPLPQFSGLNFKGQMVGWMSEVFFLQNYFLWAWEHHWSLAVEEHFYLLITLAFPLLIRYMRLAPAVFIVCIAMRLISSIYNPNGGFGETHLRLDSLFMGVCISYIYHFGDLERLYRKYKPIMIIACFLPILFIFDDPLKSQFTKTIGFTLLYISFGSMLVIFLYADVRKFCWKPITTIGFYSYGIYLFHMYFIRYIVGEEYLHDTPHTFGADTIPSFLIFFFGSIGLGIAMSHMIEKPFLAIRDKYFPRRTESSFPVSVVFTEPEREAST